MKAMIRISISRARHNPSMTIPFNNNKSNQINQSKYAFAHFICVIIGFHLFRRIQSVLSSKLSDIRIPLSVFSNSQFSALTPNSYTKLIIRDFILGVNPNNYMSYSVIHTLFSFFIFHFSFLIQIWNISHEKQFGPRIRLQSTIVYSFDAILFWIDTKPQFFLLLFSGYFTFAIAITYMTHIYI